MNEIFRCGDPDAFVSYVFGECAARERRAIEAHAAECGTCAEELASLGGTRRQLAAWVPPERTRGLQIQTWGLAASAPAETDGGAPSARGSWWRQPLPAWAQVAAAALIFAAGLATGGARHQPADTAPVSSSPPPPATVAVVPASPAPAPTAVVAPADVARIESRLLAEIAALRAAAARPAPASDPALLQRVEALIEASEERQRHELESRTTELVVDLERQRRIDLDQVQRAVGQIRGVTSEEVRQQREMINLLIDASWEPFGPQRR